MHVVVGSDKLASIAAYYGLSEQGVAAYNRIADPNSLHVGQRICIQDISSGSSAFNRNLRSFRAPIAALAPVALAKPATQLRTERRDTPMAPALSSSTIKKVLLHVSTGSAFSKTLKLSTQYANAFSYGQCTWWAAQRYFQLHGVAIPWRNGANAGQWVDRAYENGWRVSSIASAGAIIVLQGGVQGASAFGHVGIVEKVLGNGTAVVSSMNWGYRGSHVSFNAFKPGRGVTFLSQ